MVLQSCRRKKTRIAMLTTKQKTTKTHWLVTRELLSFVRTPEIVAYYCNRAACRMMMGSYQDALEDARESTRLDSSFAKGYVRIAKCCLALGDTATAFNAINKAEELDPYSDLKNEKCSIHALLQLGGKMIKSYAKGDYRKVIPRRSCIFVTLFANIMSSFKVIYCCDRSKLTKAECLALLGRYAEAEEMAK
jgi:DnaJ family protein C protein 7